jgi:hypothetical protein
MSHRYQDIVITPPQGRGYLDHVFLARQLAESRLDSIFESATVPEGLRLLLYNEVDAGLGDVAFATKLMRLLRRHVPSLEIVLVSSGPEKQGRFGLPDGVSMYEFKSYKGEASEDHRRIDLVVSAPGIFDHCRDPNTVLETLGLDLSTPFLFIAEYGSMRQLRDDAFKVHMEGVDKVLDTYLDEVALQKGLDPDSVGYRSSTGEVVSVVDGVVTSLGHLAGCLAADRADNPLLPWLVQPMLKARSAGFDTGEIGIFIEDELEPPPTQPCRSSLRERLEDEELGTLLGNHENALYVGYGHSAHGFFVDYVAVLEESNQRSIDVVIPHAASVTQAYDAIVTRPLVERLHKAGVGRLVLIGNPSEEGSEEIVERRVRELGEGKTLCLITRYPLPHSDMRTLLHMSEPSTMVSGDQSFSEAVSARKECVVIEPVYCQTFHLDAQLALAERVSPDLRFLLEFAMKFAWDDVGWVTVRQTLQSDRTRELFQRFNELTHTEHRLNERIISLVKRGLITSRSSELRLAFSEVLRVACDGFAAGRGFTLLGDDLHALAQRIP